MPVKTSALRVYIVQLPNLLTPDHIRLSSSIFTEPQKTLVSVESAKKTPLECADYGFKMTFIARCFSCGEQSNLIGIVGIIKLTIGRGISWISQICG